MDNNGKYELLPAVADLVREALQKTTHSFSTQIVGGVNAQPDGAGNTYYYDGVRFYDDAAPNMSAVAGLRRVLTHRGTWVYRVITPTVQTRRARDHERRYSIETKDPKRALRELRKYLKPYTSQQIHQAFYRNCAGVVSNWREEPSQNMDLWVTNKSLVAEVKNLISQGVTFVTEEFKRIAAESISAYEEHKRRETTKVNAYTVYMTPHEIRVSKYETSPPTEVIYATYPNFEAMPDVLQQAVGMLRMLQDGASITGLGKRVHENCYAVMEVVEDKV